MVISASLLEVILVCDIFAATKHNDFYVCVNKHVKVYGRVIH